MELVKFQNMSSCFLYSNTEKSFLDTLKPFKKGDWDSQTNNMKGIKSTIKRELSLIQGDFCIYCGFHFSLRGVSHREHIAAKSNYPEFMFEPQNLVLACPVCNSITMKSEQDTVVSYSADYAKITFKIIHPYFDDYTNEIEFVRDRQNNQVLIKAKRGSSKGHETIKMFKLDDPEYSALRAGIAMQNAIILDDDKEKLFEEIIESTYNQNH